jgi:thiosulfate/3-mercaptopyruvate sulfurtransferase
VKILSLLPVCALLLISADSTLIEPPDLVSRLSAKPAIFHVGPNVLYRSKHIPGAIYVGPGSKPEGLALLKEAVSGLPRDREIVIYCGCCPWDRCPNVQPAIALLNEMGFKRVKALHLAQSFKTDWIDHNYPIE